MVSATVFKLGSAAFLGLLTIVGALLPLRLTSVSEEKRTKILSHSSFFTGGVFLGAGLLHMLPDASHDLSSHYTFPVVFAVASLGFLLIYSLDKINFSDHQLDNAQLVSMAVSKKGGKICYVSVRPVVLSYGSFRNNQQEVVRQVQDAAQRMVKEGGVALPQQAEGGGQLAGTVDGQSILAAMSEQVDENTPIAVYPAVTVVHVNGDGQVEEESQMQPQQPVEEEKEMDLEAGRHGGKKGKGKKHKGRTAMSHLPSSKPCSDHGHSGCSSSHHKSSNNRNNRISAKHQPASTLSSDTATPASQLLDKSADVETSTWPYAGEQSGVDGGNDEGEHEHEQLHHHHINIPHHALLPIFLAIVFSIHSLIEGLALGAQQAVSSSAISILIAISSHKVIEAVSVGANFIKQGVATSTALPVLVVYTLMTPAGIVAGWLLELSLGGKGSGGGGEAGVGWGVVVQSLLQAFAAGSFLYLAVHEISDEKCCAAVKRVHQVVLMVLGLGAMALLAVWA